MKSKLSLVFAFLLFTGCEQGPVRRQKISLFIGIDVSGSFQRSGNYEAAIEFLSHYIYGHLNECGELKPLKTLFVGSIGGQAEDEAKAFHPIHDFQDKSPNQIRQDLLRWFPKSDTMTDFNVFFKQVANITQKRNLSLSPITVLLVSDGLPDFGGNKEERFENIDISPMEYLSRNIAIRLLYASPVAADRWESQIPRKRVRMWTVDAEVMRGWRAQMKEGVELKEQDKFWIWVNDNVDFRVSPTQVKGKTKKKKS